MKRNIAETYTDYSALRALTVSSTRAIPGLRAGAGAERRSLEDSDGR
jgi:hypothetical protein